MYQEHTKWFLKINTVLEKKQLYLWRISVVKKQIIIQKNFSTFETAKWSGLFLKKRAKDPGGMLG